LIELTKQISAFTSK